MAGGFYPPICKSTRRFGWLANTLHSTTNTVSVVDARPAPDVLGVPNATGTERASSSRARGSTSRRGQWRQTLLALKSSRVETLRSIFMNKGHSRRAAEVMTRYLRESSWIVYEGHWKRFVTHCQNKGLNVFNVRSRLFSSWTCLIMVFNQAPLSHTGRPLLQCYLIGSMTRQATHISPFYFAASE